jgi:hypothetical protein
VYSFSLQPEQHQPSGTCNFSRIDNATLQLQVTPKTSISSKIRVYATNYNVLRIMSGMGGLNLLVSLILMTVNQIQKAVCYSKVSSYSRKPFMSSQSSTLMV